MSKRYKINVNKTFDFDLTSNQISKLDTHPISNSHFHIIQHNKSYDTEVLGKDFQKKAYDIKINNNLYNVSISDELDILIKSMGFETGKSKNIDLIKAPMPGLIIDINISEGAEVKENDPLLILEAMKMENVLTAPRDGKIKSISANKGDAVEKNQLLIEFEK